MNELLNIYYDISLPFYFHINFNLIIYQPNRLCVLHTLYRSRCESLVLQFCTGKSFMPISWFVLISFVLALQFYDAIRSYADEYRGILNAYHFGVCSTTYSIGARNSTYHSSIMIGMSVLLSIFYHKSIFFNLYLTRIDTQIHVTNYKFYVKFTAKSYRLTIHSC